MLAEQREGAGEERKNGMTSEESRKRMEEGRLYMPGDDAIMREQTAALEKQYEFNATVRPKWRGARRF